MSLAKAQGFSAIRLSAEARLALACLGGALLSILLQGFLVGAGNNFFHLPIVMGLFDEKQFADDAYIQSLRNFNSIIWALFPKLTSETAIEASFLVLQIISRTVFFLGFALCATLLGLRAMRQQLLLIGLLAVTPLMTGTGQAGNGGLFVPMFTHSEVDNGLMLVCLYLAIRGRWIAALFVNALMFNINAFMAVWAFFPLVGLYAVAFRENYSRAFPLLKQGIAAGLAFVICASPTVIWIMSNPDFGSPLTFDFPAFLRYYTPTHFFFWSENIRPFHSITPREKVFLLIYMVCAFLAFTRLRPASRPFIVVLISFIALYATGIAAPYLTDSKLVLMLHLLRSSVFFHVLTALALLTLAVSWLTSPKPEYAYGLGPLLAVVSCTFGTLIPLAALVLLFERPIAAVASFFDRHRWRAALLAGRIAAAALILAVCTYKSEKSWAGRAESDRLLTAWKDLGAWAQANTAEESLFLLPVVPFGTDSAQPDIHGPHVYSDWGSFEAVARRRAWVDFRRGAAAMWQPSYFEIWSKRVADVLALPDLKAKIAYAETNNIHYVVTQCVEKDGKSFTPLFQNDYVCLYGALKGSASRE